MNIIQKIKALARARKARKAISDFFTELAVSGLVLGVSVYLLATFKGSVNDTEAQAAVGSVQNLLSTYGPMILLIMIFVVIIAAVMKMKAKGGGGR